MTAMTYLQVEKGDIPLSDDYDPNSLLNALLVKMHLQDDAELAQKLKMDKDLLTKIRERRLQISASMLFLMQESTGFSVVELRKLLKDRRKTFRMPYAQPDSRL